MRARSAGSQPGPIRRIVGFVMALSMTLGGGTLIVLELLSPHVPSSKKAFKLVFLGAGWLAALGAYWLWIDYINPSGDLDQ